MGTYIKSNEFIEIALAANMDPRAIKAELQATYPTYTVSTSQIVQRISNYRRRGLIPLDSGNEVSLGEVLKGTSTLYGPDNEILQQWVKTDVPKEDFLAAFQEAVSEIAQQTPTGKEIPSPSVPLDEDNLTLYISNDIHFGALMWDKESGKDWNLDIAQKTVKAAYDYLFQCSPSSKIGVVCDLGR